MDSKINEQIDYINRIKKINKNKKLKYLIYTMGCQLNENDSEKLAGMLENMGYTKTDVMQESDLIIFNTCCVRENAEDKVFGKLGEVKILKEQKGTIIAICGCMMQEKHIVEKLNKSYPFIDIIFGTHTLHKFPQDVLNVLEDRKKVQDVIDIDGEIHEGLPIKRNDNVRASVTIMYGCNNFCSYCIVPYVRGRERSRNPKDIITEIESLAKEGYKEITLLGQNVNSYMKSTEISFENYKNINSFATLLREINKIDGLEVIKFISPHPKDFTLDVIQAIRDCEKVSKLIHLPLQSGSTEVLKVMNRKYTKQQYLDLVGQMKNEIPNVSFSTDIIVGFPGETEKDFEDTLDVIKRVNFEQVFMFIYSKRVGTPAEKMKNQVPENIKHERFDRLKELVENLMQDNNKKLIGETYKILVEGLSKTNEQMYTGRNYNNKVVIFEAKEELIGKVVNVKIISEHKWYLKGEIIDNM